MTQKTRTSCTYWSPLYPEKSVLKSKGGSIWISNIWKYLTWNYKNANNVLVLKHPKNMHIEFFSISEVAAEKRHDFISNQGKAFAHWSGMTVSTRDRLHNSSFFFKSTHPLSHWLCIVHQQWWEDMKNKLIPTQHLHVVRMQARWSSSCLHSARVFCIADNWFMPMALSVHRSLLSTARA